MSVPSLVTNHGAVSVTYDRAFDILYASRLVDHDGPSYDREPAPGVIVTVLSRSQVPIGVIIMDYSEQDVSVLSDVLPFTIDIPTIDAYYGIVRG